MNDLDFTQKLPKTLLRPYQTELIEKCKAVDFYGLFLSVGLGKTITMGTVIADLNLRTLIVSTPRICDFVWEVELSAWEHTAGLSVSNLHVAPKKRKALLGAQVLLISFDLLDWFIKQNCHVDMIIVDESSLIKNSSSKRYKNLRKPRFAPWP